MNKVMVELSYSEQSGAWTLHLRTVNGYGLLTVVLDEKKFSRLLSEQRTDGKVWYINEDIVKYISDVKE